MKPVTTIFEFMAEGKIYQTKATRYINGAGEVCYRVSVNNSAVITFVSDNIKDTYVPKNDSRNPNISAAAEAIIGQQLSRKTHSAAA